MARLIIGLVLLYIALHGGSPQFGQQAARFLVPVALALIFSSMLSAVAHGNLFKQRQKNSKAWRLLSRTDRAQRFVLYLRSFDTDEHAVPPRLHSKLTDLMAELESNGAFGSGSDIVRLIEHSVAKAFGRQTPVVGLAGPSAFMGPGQVVAFDAEWKNVIAGLCRDAKAIVFVVGGSRGVQWELGYLQQVGYLRKTIFLVPPLHQLKNYYGPAADVVVTRTYRIFDEFRIQLPLPGSRAKLFTIGVPQPSTPPDSGDALTDALRRCAIPAAAD